VAGRPTRDARRYLAEALGTFALVAVGNGATMVAASTGAFGHAAGALVWGVVVTTVVVATGHLGGAHVNPAVTVALWSVRRFPGRDVVPYALAQCLGAIAASAFLLWLLGPVARLGATVPALSVGRVFVIEAAYSGLLALVIMAVATDVRTPPAVAPFALGGTVFVGALVTGPLTGGSFNPARSLGPAVMAQVWTAHWLYWAAPVLGMVAAMHLYEALRGADATTVPRDAPLGVEGPIDAPLPAPARR
jgi:MIP family channel proteins